MMEIKRALWESRLIVKIRKNITWKLFIITALVFIIFISSTLIFQSLFFGKFYINKKEKDIQNETQKFKTIYNRTEDENEVIDAIRNFEEDNNAKLVIMDREGKIKFITRLSSENYDAARIKMIDEIITKWASSYNLLNEMKRYNKAVTLITDWEIYGRKNILTAVPDNKKGEIIFAITSLQPVDEASSVIKEFYVYFYIGAVILILLLSLIYTNMVSKPLLKLNNTAKKMASLDFSEKCNIRNEDEIGNLADTMNFLSYNLDKALTSLKSANEKLEKDIERERKIEKVRKEFVASVSHELKTPINLIEGYAEGLRDNVFETGEKDYYIDVIIDESNKMANLVADMLKLSHLESGTIKLDREMFFMDELITSASRKFLKVIKDKNIRVDFKMLKQVKIYADWDKMEQVVDNFTTNAIKNTETGGSINFSMTGMGNRVVVSVENTGKNIPEEAIDKIWNNFYKIDKSRNRELGGTGIGLAIVKNILELHGYEYGVKNTDKGVIFYFIVDIAQ